MKYANQGHYINLKFKPDLAKHLIADFYMECPKSQVKMCAAGLAAESSTGTWTPLHHHQKSFKNLAAIVFKISGNNVKVAYPLDIFEAGSVPQFLSDAAGNIFGMKIVKNLRLNDFTIPAAYAKTFKGPAFGMPGVRKIFRTDKTGRPHTGTIVKPKVGLNPKQTAEVAYQAWAGGLDFVKDDENLTDQKFCRFKDRIPLVLDACDRAQSETGEKKVYAPNITGVDMAERAQYVKDHGGKCIMIDILTVGYGALQHIRNMNWGMFIHAHRAMHAAITRNSKHGISMLALAKLARLSGVDQLHIGTGVGKMQGQAQEIKQIHDAMNKPLHNIKPVFSVCSGGLHPGMTPALVRYYGKDIVIQCGGGVHGHPGGTKVGGTALRQAVDAVMKKQTLKQYAKKHIELDTAIGQWGVVK
jgi:ribulose-bisphosphate carboxylase large chain|tara:strand:+ start:696 stop:1937 length:1242 start_codon:yes stop_codon:yes gene_type:complete